MTTRTFVIGDIHGRFEALKEVLANSKFDYEEDKLILLGDLVDGGANTKEVVDELLKIKNTIFVRGNHDQWFIGFIEKNSMPAIWTSQGGWATLTSYGYPKIKIPDRHKKFFLKSIYYYIVGTSVFMHGGYRAGLKTVEDEDPEVLMWDRELIARMYSGLIIGAWDRIFVGHTSTQYYDSLEPCRFGKLIMMDTGAGWSGKLSIMDIDTEQVWQSELQKPNP